MEEIQNAQPVPITISPKEAITIAKNEFGIVVGHKKMVAWCEFHKCAKQPGGIGGKIYINPVELRRFLENGTYIHCRKPGRPKKAAVEGADTSTVTKTRRAGRS